MWPVHLGAGSIVVVLVENRASRPVGTAARVTGAEATAAPLVDPGDHP